MAMRGDNQTGPIATGDEGGRNDWPPRADDALLDEADRADLEARLAMTPMERLLELEQVVHELEQIRRADVPSR